MEVAVQTSIWLKTVEDFDVANLRRLIWKSMEKNYNDKEEYEMRVLT